MLAVWWHSFESLRETTDIIYWLIPAENIVVEFHSQGTQLSADRLDASITSPLRRLIKMIHAQRHLNFVWN